MAAIRTYRKLLTADSLLRDSNRANMARLRRNEDVTACLGTFSIVIRCQRPLDPDCLELDSGWTLADYVETLNRRVFFWPGTEIGPTSDGERMALLEGEAGVMLRMPTSSLLDFNRHVLPIFSPHNTGAAWLENKKKSHRGDRSFLLCEQYIESADTIVEVSFEGAINLPYDTSVAPCLEGPWVPME